LYIERYGMDIQYTFDRTLVYENETTTLAPIVEFALSVPTASFERTM
jgi:hypothetical protein